VDGENPGGWCMVAGGWWWWMARTVATGGVAKSTQVIHAIK
jgi:hypothetical protein